MLIDGKYIYDNKEICELFVEQYNEQFSKGNQPREYTGNDFSSLDKEALSKLLSLPIWSDAYLKAAPCKSARLESRQPY